MATAKPASGTDTPNARRYTVESFKRTSAKLVPFEELNYSIYKANHVTFSTSEKRLPRWINIMKQRYRNGLEGNDTITSQYEETDNPKEKAKCEKIIITLTSKQTQQNMLTITITISTGRIQIQGQYMKEWGNTEFGTLVELINSSNDTTVDATKDIKIFLETTSQSVKRPNTNTSATTAEKPHSEKPTSTSSPKEKILPTIKANLASLEAEFVEFSQSTNKTIHNLTTLMAKKDEEIELLKTEINTLKSAKTHDQQSFCDLTLKQLELEEQICQLHQKFKSLKKENTDLRCQVAALQETRKQPTDQSEAPNERNITLSEPQLPKPADDPTTAYTPTTTTTTIPIYNIPTNNKFEHLSKDPNPNSQSPTSNKPPKTPTPTDSSEEAPESRSNIDTVIICDSNGRYINPTLLCPGSKTKYVRCPTLAQAEAIIQKSKFGSPKSIIIHCGTNDLEVNTSNEEINGQLQEVIKCIQTTYPTSRIIISCLLPRSDDMNKRVVEVNKTILKTFCKNKNIKTVEHSNIDSAKHLKDKKHLNDIGVKCFALNLKRAYFNKNPQSVNRYHAKPKQLMDIRFPKPAPFNHHASASYIPRNQRPRNDPHINHTPHQHSYPNSPFHPYNPYHPHHQQMQRNQMPNALGEQRKRRSQDILPMEMIELIKHLNRYIN